MGFGGASPTLLAERAVGLAWRLRRAERIQTQVFDSMLFEEATCPGRKLLRSMRPKAVAEEQEKLALGRVVVRDFANDRVLDRLGLYERRIESSLYRTMGELQKLRLLRELDEPPAEATPEPVARTEDEPLRQTKPISPFAALKTGSERENEGQQSQFSGLAGRRWTAGTA